MRWCRGLFWLCAHALTGRRVACLSSRCGPQFPRARHRARKHAVAGDAVMPTCFLPLQSANASNGGGAAPTPGGAATDADSDARCGWCFFRPRLLQRFRTAKWVLFWLCWGGAVQGILFQLFLLKLTTLVAVLLSPKYLLHQFSRSVLLSQHISVSYLSNASRQSGYILFQIFVNRTFVSIVRPFLSYLLKQRFPLWNQLPRKRDKLKADNRFQWIPITLFLLEKLKYKLPNFEPRNKRKVKTFQLLAAANWYDIF